jgi:hypothetical protein
MLAHYDKGSHMYIRGIFVQLYYGYLLETIQKQQVNHFDIMSVVVFCMFILLGGVHRHC